MILEGIVTTLDAEGQVHISPMGPEVDAAMRRFVLKPYRTSNTYANLKRSGQGVFHVTDDVELIAHCAVGVPDPLPGLIDAPSVQGKVLRDACRWYAFRVDALDDRQDRTRIDCEVVAEGRQRDFFGFNRAKHAVLEAAILATRIEFLPRDEILSEFDRLAVLVKKTGGPAEHRAFDFLKAYVETTSAKSAVDSRPSPS